MSKRDKIREILAKRSRSGRGNSRYQALVERETAVLRSVSEVLLDVDAENQAELLRYVPISLAGCIEGYFRRAIQDLIDFKEDYRENLLAFKDLRFGVDSVLAIHGRSVTLGEFIAHDLPISRLEHIDHHISRLIGESFFTKVRNQSSSQIGTPNNKLPETVFGNIEKIFETRHVYCHELANEPILDSGIAYLYLIDTDWFLHAAEGVIAELAGPEPELIARLLLQNADRGD